MTITYEEIQLNKAKRRDELEQALDDITSQLIALGAQKIVLFGSFANGNIGRWSDLDLLAIMPPTRTGKKWMQKISVEVNRDIATDIIAFTAAELADALPNNRFLRHVLNTGKVIYAK